MATLASASWATRSRVTSTSGCMAAASPVVVTSAGTPLVADQRATSLASASGSLASPAPAAAAPAPSGGPRPGCPGPAAWRCRSAASRSVVAPGLLGRLELGDDAGQALGQRVVDLPRPSAAARPRRPPPGPGSAAGPAGRCSPRSSPPAAGWPGPARRSSASGPGSAPRSSRRAGRTPRSATTSTQASTTQMATGDTVGRWNPPPWPMPKKTATTAQAAHRHAPGRYRNACRKPSQVKKREPGTADGEHGDERDQPGDVEPHQPRRSAQPGCRTVNQVIQAPAATATPTVMPNAPASGLGRAHKGGAGRRAAGTGHPRTATRTAAPATRGRCPASAPSPLLLPYA